MKKIFFVFCFLIAFNLSNAQPPNVPADKGAIFGAGASADNAVSVEQMISIMSVPGNENKKVDIKVEGIVTEVCEEMGCWIKLKSTNGDIMVRMKGHSFFVPLVLNGKKVVIDGTAQERITTIEELKDVAKDAGKSQEEIDAIKEPKKEIVLEAKGVLVL